MKEKYTISPFLKQIHQQHQTSIILVCEQAHHKTQTITLAIKPCRLGGGGIFPYLGMLLGFHGDDAHF